MDQSLVSSKTLNVQDRNSPTSQKYKSDNNTPKKQSQLSRHRSNSKLTPVQEQAQSPQILSNRVAKTQANNSMPSETLRFQAEEDQNLSRKPSISKSIKSSMMRPMNRQSKQYSLPQGAHNNIVQFSEEQLEMLDNSRQNVNSN